MNRITRYLILLVLGAACSMAQAQTLGNAWHVPTNSVPNSTATMRSPLSNIDGGTTVTIYNGNQFQGSGNPGNQSGGAVFYRSAGGTYQSVNLNFFTESGNDKFWSASFAAPATGPIEYYVQVNYTDHSTTYLYGTDSTSNATADSAFAAAHPYAVSTTPSLTVNGLNANYTTEHVYVDEIAGDSVPFSVVFSPNAINVDPATVQVFTNLNRRDYATLAYTDNNGLATEEGINPPSGDVVGTNDSHYYKAYSMIASGGQYSLTLDASNSGPAKTGAYRLTARYRTLGSNTWIYYSTNGRRDHAIVVSPNTARKLNLYEANVLNIDASGDQMAQRSTFADLHNSAKRWNLDYVKNLGSNFIWFQPIHPNGIDGRQIDPDTGQPLRLAALRGKEFFRYHGTHGSGQHAPGAMAEFQGFHDRDG